MAKHDKTYSMKGTFDFGKGIIKEFIPKTEEEKVYDLFARLNEFDGQYITITIKSSTELPADEVRVSRFVTEGQEDEEDIEEEKEQDHSEEEYDE